uniref:Skp1_POZ domain-containing protein n=1 Tax=Steinernema glaseri TaxID=37863 RepID=A0A1I7YCK4_9BILA
MARVFMVRRQTRTINLFSRFKEPERVELSVPLEFAIDKGQWPHSRSPSTMASQTVKLTSSDGQEFEFKRTEIKKIDMLETMLNHLGFGEDAPEEPIPMQSIDGDALRVIAQWLLLHEEDKPHTWEHRHFHRFDLNVSKEDMELLDSLTQSLLAAVIKAAYYLDMSEFIDTLVKYVAKTRWDEMSQVV